MQHLHVALNGIVVGKLTKLTNGGITFQYAQPWLETPEARPISLSMPLQHKAYQGNVVYNFFDNLLPENELVKERIQAKFRAPTKQPFDLLAKVGMDCIGALQLYPAHTTIPTIKKITAQPLTETEIATLLRSNQYGNPLGMTGSDEFRISLAGVQEKTGLL